MSELRFPTVDDLRVKLCYICREEERYDHPEDPPRAWTHPCNCTLIAHESCLLHWIRASQQDRTLAANALKCPQCGATYELESENPPILRYLDAGNRTLSVMGKLVTGASLSAIAVTFGTGLYTLSTAYGAHALEQFIGKEMYNLLLTDDPANWPWHAFINLPLIPASLILSRTPLASNMLPIIPLLLSWPNSTPVASRDRVVAAWRRTYSGFGAAPQHRSVVDVLSIHWPPSTGLLGMLVLPLVRALYRVCWTRLTHYVMNTTPQRRPRGPRFRMEGGLPRLRLRFGVGPMPPQGPQGLQPQQQQPPLPPADANANNGHADAAAAVAEHTIHVNGASLGRLIGGALIIPKISNVMGWILYKLSAHSSLLRRFLAIYPRELKVMPSQEWWEGPAGFARWSGLGIVGKVGLTFRLMWGQVWRGSSTWADGDPVWWRNLIGFGVFVVAKDCIHLLHLWLARRELQSRRVKNKSFEGVDPRELDLIPGFPGT